VVWIPLLIIDTDTMLIEIVSKQPEEVGRGLKIDPNILFCASCGGGISQLLMFLRFSKCKTTVWELMVYFLVFRWQCHAQFELSLLQWRSTYLPAVHDRTEGVPDRWRSCLERSSIWRYVCSVAGRLWTRLKTELFRRCYNAAILPDCSLVVLEMDFLFRPL